MRVRVRVRFRVRVRVPCFVWGARIDGRDGEGEDEGDGEGEESLGFGANPTLEINHELNEGSESIYEI